MVSGQGVLGRQPSISKGPGVWPIASRGLGCLPGRPRGALAEPPVTIQVPDQDPQLVDGCNADLRADGRLLPHGLLA